ncbi:hypothetical protein WICPIJ_002317, partial [Wickerhamomyces pijperi]
MHHFQQSVPIYQFSDQVNYKEEKYIYERQRITQDSIYSYLRRVKIPGFDLKKFQLSCLDPITSGIAISGGGYRSFLTGAGLLAAFDDRSYNSTKFGHVGGLLQGSSYIAGISGGSWILMSLILSDFKPIVRLRQEWEIYEPLLEGVPNLKQMEVSRADIQVLPVELKDTDSAFYNKLNNKDGLKAVGVAKREFKDEGDTVNYFDEFFEEFYQNLEFLPEFNACSDEEGEEEHEDSELLKRNIFPHPAMFDKREEPPVKNDWLDKFKMFFTELFNSKMKDDGFKPARMLPSIELSKEQLSLKSIKRVFNFYKNLHLEVRSKKVAGFPVSFTDYWGRALSRRIFPKEARSPNQTFTSVTQLPSFKAYQQPFPIILTNLREPGVEKTSVDSNIFEFTPYEFGSFDLKVFCNLKYLGTLLYNGNPVFHIANQSVCFSSFDNAGFITGTSSSLFNNVLIYVWKMAAAFTKENNRAIKAVLNTFGLTANSMETGNAQNHPDYALYTPNPFYKYGSFNEIYNSKNLYMVDGGEDGQNLPFQPLLQKSRKLDIIFSIDATVDSKGWPNGTVLQTTEQRYNETSHEGAYITTVDGRTRYINLFPKIPSNEEMVQKGLNKRPVFFGCYLENYQTRKFHNQDVTHLNEYFPPIIGYYSNQNISYHSNTSTFKLTYDTKEVSGMIENAYNILSYSNSTIDTKYSACIGCLLIKREFDKKLRDLSLINDMKSHSSLKVGELTRYQITYTPTQQTAPQPSLWISIRNTEPLPLRAAVLRGPYLLYVDVRTEEYHHNVPSFITADQPKFAANLLPSEHFNAELSCHLIKDRYVWIVDVVSQILFSAGTDVGYEIVIADSKAGLTTHDHMTEQGVFSDDLVVNVLDTIDLWNLPSPVKQKKYHLVILTHGLHSNTHADMFYIKEQIDRMARDKGKDIIVRGFNGNVCKTEKGIRYLGSRLAEFIVNELYKENIDKISFIGHSLGGLIQTFAIAYIQLNFPWFFQKVEPINFITMASPLLGIVNDNPTYVKAALFMGAVGRTGSELGLDSTSIDGGVPLLKLLPTGPAHHILKKFKHRTLYANSVNDGIVPLYTSALAFVDWKAINQVPNLQNSQCDSKGTADLTSETSETSGLLHDTARTLIDPVHKAISLLAPSLQRGSSSSSRNNETSEDMNNFPKASMIESAASVLIPPTPP